MVLFSGRSLLLLWSRHLVGDLKLLSYGEALRSSMVAEHGLLAKVETEIHRSLYFPTSVSPDQADGL